jgi:aspartyl-tRNA(Asn)/glutamyl-tRNA(Gln) amidotransferase subunit A
VSRSFATDRVRHALEQARRAQATLNVFTQIDDERAMARAAELDVPVESGADPGPLTGVPVGLKDLIDHQGRVTTCGSAFYRVQASGSAPVVERLEAAGAVIVGRTGLHEFAFGFSSENPHFGPVRNPWDPATSPGGSSGGSGAAVAAGITPVAIGTDTGGSIRVPAALCGCYGLKVTHGRISLEGVFPLVPSVDTVGPLADSIENLDIAYRVLSGDLSLEPSPVHLRIGIPQPWTDDAPMDDEVDAAFTLATQHLAELGHEVVTVHLPDVLPGREIILAIAEEVTDVHREFRAQRLPYGEDVAARLEDCEAVTPEESRTGRAWQQLIRGRFADAFETVDLLVTPTVPVMRKVIGVDTIGDLHYRAVLSWFSALVNHTLHPALAMPLVDQGAPPVSLQAIGPMGSEAGLLGFGRALESAGVVGFTPAIVKPG